MLKRLRENSFLFEELIKRDFKKKYKRTFLGMVWSMLGPLLQLLVMSLVFTKFFGRNTPHYTIYLFSGNLLFSYFKESTNGGMASLIGNSEIIKKINIPKYLFLFSRNVSALINFLLTFLVFLIFCAADRIDFGFRFFALLYPVCCLLVFNIGVGFILSALFVFFKDIQYLYDIFTLLLMYLSAIFYTTDRYSYNVQMMFYMNPMFVFIRYFRIVVIENRIPAASFHALCAFYAAAVFSIGALMYKRLNYRFLYYM